MKGDIFHILNRGVEKRKVFLDGEDYLRFVYNLYDFNNKNLSLMSYYERRKSFLTMRNLRTEDEEIVNVVCWCLMPNHYHVLIQEKVDGGAGVFSKKLSSGYTQYFNLKNERSGVLFQGKSKIIPVKHDEHFLHIPYYILSNPIKIIEPTWKEDGIKDLKKTVNFLENYKWSNLSDITGEGDFSYMINKKLFFELFDTSGKQFKDDFIEWLNNSAIG